MSRKKIIEEYPCDICKHKLKSYFDYEQHREYFHGKNIEKTLEKREGANEE